jgi:hypothetical protein
MPIIAKTATVGRGKPSLLTTFARFVGLLSPPTECIRRYTTMQTTHQQALETKHATLDRRIADEVHRPMPDATILTGLKRQKLKLKEELSGL